MAGVALNIMQVQASLFMEYAQGIMHNAVLHSTKRKQLSRETELRRFRALFGVAPHTCSSVWTRLQGVIPEGGSPVHLLWALLFLKVYATEHVNKGLTGANEKTFRKWSWTFVELMANMHVVSSFCLFIILHSAATSGI